MKKILKVLILVLVEDGLRESIMETIKLPNRYGVLILVLVEDGLRGSAQQIKKTDLKKGINPCSCGGWSQRMGKSQARRLKEAAS